MPKIIFNGLSYGSGIGGGGNANFVELTKAEYDALDAAGEVKADTLYLIKDGTIGTDAGMGSTDISGIGDGTVTGAIEALDSKSVSACGVTDIWTWRKWENGVAECWGKISGNMTYSPVGAIYGVSFPSVVTFPFEFIEKPVLNITTESSNGYAMAVLINESCLTTSELLPCWIVSPLEGTETVTLHFQVKGKWK